MCTHIASLWYLKPPLPPTKNSFPIATKSLVRVYEIEIEKLKRNWLNLKWCGAKEQKKSNTQSLFLCFNFPRCSLDFLSDDMRTKTTRQLQRVKCSQLFRYVGEREWKPKENVCFNYMPIRLSLVDEKNFLYFQRSRDERRNSNFNTATTTTIGVYKCDLQNWQ